MYNYTPLQREHATKYLSDIIQNMPDKALNTLIKGYDRDQNALIRSMFHEINRVMQINSTIRSENLQYLSDLETAIDLRLKKLSYNYFKTTVLKDMIVQNERNLEWGNMIQLYPWSGYLAARGHGKSFEFGVATPLWRLYGYDRPNEVVRPTDRFNKNFKETCLITNTGTQGSLNVTKISEEIKVNPILNDKLNRNGRALLGSTAIRTETGSELHLRSKDSMIRGLHVGYTGVDDFPDESSLYSIDQRMKLEEIFYGSIVPIVEPDGYLIVSGTPFSQGDIYSKLKSDKNFKFFEYPAIFPNGRLLAPDRFSYDKLVEIKHSLGTIRFTREYLCVPISDDATLFPYDFLRLGLIGMENVSYANNIFDYPFKMRRVVVGADFAKSGKVGADYTVYTVWGLDMSGNYHLMYYWRKKGASFQEQINTIISIDQRFKPDKIVCESNGFQAIFSDELTTRGLRNIKPFNTDGTVKRDWENGLPTLSAMFERGEIKFPYKFGETREGTDIVMGEFNSITIKPDSGKVESLSDHDDLVMSSFFAIYDLKTNQANTYKFYEA